MTKTLDVLVVGRDRIATEQAMAQLEARGHRVHTCHEPGEPAFPCVGLLDPAACPLDAGIDVALLVRRGVHPGPLVEEDGVRCALRAGIPVVEDGSDILDPFDPWITDRVHASSDISAACMAAADRRFDELRSLVRQRIAGLAAAVGISALDTACLISHAAGDLVIDLHVPVALSAQQQQAFAVRVLDAVHASGRTYGQVNVNVHHVPEPLTVS
jgi:hypothetical protein